MICKYLPPILQISFHILETVFASTKVFNIDDQSICNFLLLFMHQVVFQSPPPNIRPFLLYFILSVLCYQFLYIGHWFISELIFISMSQEFKFILWHLEIQLSQPHLLKRLFFLHWINITPLSTISWLHIMGTYFED